MNTNTAMSRFRKRPVRGFTALIGIASNASSRVDDGKAEAP